MPGYIYMPAKASLYIPAYLFHNHTSQIYMIRKTVISLYCLIIICMGTATFIEKWYGTEFVHLRIYGAWWFTAAWGLLAAAGIIYFVRSHVRRRSATALHLSFAIILLGAMLTRVSARHGSLHLRCGETAGRYYADCGNGNTEELTLPFEISLDSFYIDYHEGTEAAADYVSVVTVRDNGGKTRHKVSMNKILSHNSMRLYQASYDEDGQGSVLAVSSDPWGIPVTYTGYALLFLSLAWMLADPRGGFRRLLRHPLLRRGALIMIVSAAGVHTVSAVPARPKDVAGKFGQLNILYNNRICPMQTFAIDFTKKLYGDTSYKGYTAEQVLTGFIFYGDEWSNEPVIRMKGGAMKSRLQLPGYVSVNTFFNRDMGGYTIGPYLQEYYKGADDEFHRNVADMDDRLQLVMNLRRGTLLKVFPCTDSSGHTVWHAPTGKLPAGMDETQKAYIQNVFTLLYQYVMAADTAGFRAVTDKMIRYQHKNGGNSLPGKNRITAERIYNAIPFAKILFMVNLAMGLVTLAAAIFRLTHRNTERYRQKLYSHAATAVMAASFAALTVCGALRWIVSGTIPMANGYETMLLMAWCIQFVSIVTYRRFRIMQTFGFLLSGLFLLVAHISGMDPQITHVMPVLSSPLLSIHVSMIMMAFALLSLTFVCGMTALTLHAARKGTGVETATDMEALRLLSLLFLYPALATLGAGIFIGAVWANVSWGTYWSWDPKEVWALIVFMVYGCAVHHRSIPQMRRPMFFHAFMTAAFLTILMTYFGVNYFLGGMHSYA